MSNFHFNINYKLKSKADSRQILKLDSLRSATTSSFQPKGLEHILIKRMCDGKLKQKDLLNQLFSKQSCQDVLSKQKGFYYEDKREVASVKEFFHFYKLVSSEKNNIQRQEFNEQLQKKTEKIINILHDKNQVYKERQQTLSDDVPIKSLHSLTNQSSKEYLYHAQLQNQTNQHKFTEQGYSKMSSVEVGGDIQKKKVSIDNNPLQKATLQSKSSLKVQSQRKFIPFDSKLDSKKYFISPPPSTRLIGNAEEIGLTIPTSPSYHVKQPLTSPMSIPSSQAINTQSTRLITIQDQGKNKLDHQSSLPIQLTPLLSPQAVLSTEKVPIIQEKSFKQLRYNKVKDLNLSDLSQGMQQGSTLQSNTGSRRVTNQVPVPNRSNQPSQLSKRAQSAQQDNIRFTPLLTSYSNQNAIDEKNIPYSNIQNPIEFQNSKIQQLLNDFNDSVLELEPNNISELNHQIQVLSPSNQSEIQINQNSQKSLFLKGVSRNNSISSQPYFDFPTSHQNLKEIKAQVSFSLPQSTQKGDQQETHNENKYYPSTMVNLQQQNSLNESLNSVPRGRVKSYSPNKEPKSIKEFNFDQEDIVGESEKHLSLKQFHSERQKSLQFTMKQADKFLHSHDSLAGTKVNFQGKDKKLQFIGQVFKSATNFDIIISNQINHSIEKRRKKLNSACKSSITSKVSHDSNQQEKVKDGIHDSQITYKDDHLEKEMKRDEIAMQSQESEHDLSSIHSLNKRGRISSEVIKSKNKRDISYQENIEEVQEDQDELPKQAYLKVQTLKEQNLLVNEGNKKYGSKAIKNLDKDISTNIQKIDSLLAKKAGLNLFLDKERINSPLSYKSKQFHTRSEVGKHYNVQKYFDIQKTLAIDYSNAKKNIKFQQFDNKVYTKNTDYVDFYH